MRRPLKIADRFGAILRSPTRLPTDPLECEEIEKGGDSINWQPALNFGVCWPSVFPVWHWHKPLILAPFWRQK
jgi:hypothetical protein